MLCLPSKFARKRAVCRYTTLILFLKFLRLTSKCLQSDTHVKNKTIVKLLCGGSNSSTQVLQGLGKIVRKLLAKGGIEEDALVTKLVCECCEPPRLASGSSPYAVAVRTIVFCCCCNCKCFVAIVLVIVSTIPFS